VTSDGALILIRELDEQLGLEKFIAEQLSDSRRGVNRQFTLTDLRRQVGLQPLGGLRGSSCKIFKPKRMHERVSNRTWKFGRVFRQFLFVD